jgi:leucyl/phenylalanyl-tRNA--protein transferase
VIDPLSLHVSKSLQKQLRKQDYHVTFNQSFVQVIEACAQRDYKTDTWINSDMIMAYTELNRLGKAHSVEIWQDKKLVGGAYGVAVGGVFCGESMFSYQPNASKIALVHLCGHIVELGFKLIDCQLVTDHLISMGAKPLDKSIFLQKLKQWRDCEIKWSNQYLSVNTDK